MREASRTHNDISNGIPTWWKSKDRTGKAFLEVLLWLVSSTWLLLVVWRWSWSPFTLPVGRSWELAVPSGNSVPTKNTTNVTVTSLLPIKLFKQQGERASSRQAIARKLLEHVYAARLPGAKNELMYHKFVKLNNVSWLSCRTCNFGRSIRSWYPHSSPPRSLPSELKSWEQHTLPRLACKAGNVRSKSPNQTLTSGYCLDLLYIFCSGTLCISQWVTRVIG